VKIDRIVVNASPLIVLFKAGLSELLPQLFTVIMVPSAVWNEILAGDATDAAARALPTTAWLKRVDVSAIPTIITAWDLGPGESQVLSLALDNPSARAVIDDAAARSCAATLRVPILGTGGILVLAKRRGLINSVTVSLDELRKADLWLSDYITNLFIKLAGE
jgi:predicted nucleic acid-binding protein